MLLTKGLLMKSYRINTKHPSKENIFMKYFTSKVVVYTAIYRLIVYFWRPEPTHLGLFPS